MRVSCQCPPAVESAGAGFTIIAVVRRTPSALGVAALNFFLGWTVIGWIVALVIALAVYPAERVVIIEGRARY